MNEINPARSLVKNRMLQAARDIAGLYNQIQRRLGLGYFGVYYCHGASLGAFNLVDFLATSDVAETFHIMIVVLSNVARRWTLVRGILRMLWITLQERKLDEHLASATTALFKLNAVDS